MMLLCLMKMWYRFMIRVVLFDLDDTLFSEEEYIKSGYKYISTIIGKTHHLNEKKVYNDLYSLYKIDSKNVFNRLLAKYGIKYTRQDISELVSQYRNHTPNITFYDDVIPAITELKKMGIKVGIISDGYLSTQLNKARVLRLHELFDKVIFTDELGREYWKPNPKAFELMKEYFNVNYDEMMYVGDNPEKDFYISSIYPIQTVRIIRKQCVYLSKKYYKNVREHFKVSVLIEIIAVLSKFYS